MKKLLLAFQFLTIIPVKDTGIVSDREVGGSAAFFPLIGIVQGALLVCAAATLLRIFPIGLTNLLVMLLLVITNGALHLDGLADTFDAIASRGDRQKKLAIMKDSTIGPAGVIAIVFVLMLKYLLLNEAYSSSTPATYYLILFLLPIYSRWAMVPAIFHCRSARADGLGKAFIENVGVKELLTATALSLIFSLLAVFVIFHKPDLAHVAFSLPALYIFSLITVWFCGRRFGGMTGDTFGAVSELSEILFLMMAVICLRNFTS
ncbi:MAG: adenosylcobinamide-GDP ribazoletransferase [Thermodesulfovibrionia bacterium]|nr:adenosylcobinamide-GDP ribazoletransferase [Thermodesulfovibrionia bacterium]